MTKRYARFLRPTKSDRQPRQLAFLSCKSYTTIAIDSKTREIEHLESWDLLYVELDKAKIRKVSEHHGKSWRELCVAISNSCGATGSTTVYSFNTARILSLLHFWNELENGSVQLSEGIAERDKPDESMGLVRPMGFAVLEDPPTIVHCRDRDTRLSLRFVDLRNYGITSESQLGPDRSTPHNMRRFVVGMIGVLVRRKWGALQNTSGSQARYTWKHSYLQHMVHIHTNQEALNLERESMHGGRCEVFRMGVAKERVWQLDFRSLYPACCVGRSLPTLLVSYNPSPTMEDLSDNILAYHCFAHVTIATDLPEYPLTRDNLTIYPVGTFNTFLCGHELRNAFLRKQVLKVHSLALYDGTKCFSDFMLDWHSERSDAERRKDKALATWIKSVMVSAVGKTGQRNKRWVDRPNSIAPTPYSSWYVKNGNGTYTRWRSIAWHCQEDVDGGEHPESCPAVAAFVYSSARQFLWGALQLAGLENCYYCDTDSVWCNDEGLRQISDAKMLDVGVMGKLRVVDSYADVEFLGWKYYRIGDRIVCAGLPKGHVSDIDSRGKYWYQSSLGESLIHGSAPDVSYEQRRVEKRGRYKHGHVREDGRVEPYRIQEGLEGDTV